MINEALIKAAVGTLIPAVLGMGIWVGSMENRVSGQDIVNTNTRADVKEVKDKVEQVDKRVIAILCKVVPEKCPVN